MNSRAQEIFGDAAPSPNYVKAVKCVILALLVGLVVMKVACLPPVPQDPEYHRFADQRSLWQFPNALNVLSNLPFMIVGIAGLALTIRRQSGSGGPRFQFDRERWLFAAFFLGVSLTAFGSSWYHWAPDNASLVWDRLPMTLGFVSLLAIAITERVNAPLGYCLFAPLLVAGLLSVVYWRLSGDLKFYLLTQYASLALVLGIVTLFPSRYTRTSEFYVALGLYATAKVFERLDDPIYRLGIGVSGHTLKHLAASLSSACLLHMIRFRKPLADAHSANSLSEFEDVRDTR